MGAQAVAMHTAAQMKIKTLDCNVRVHVKNYRIWFGLFILGSPWIIVIRIPETCSRFLTKS